MSAQADQSIELAGKIEPLLKGAHPSVQGSVLAQLLAKWVKGHHATNDGDTDSVREDVLQMHVKAVRQMIKVL